MLFWAVGSAPAAASKASLFYWRVLQAAGRTGGERARFLQAGRHILVATQPICPSGDLATSAEASNHRWEEARGDAPCSLLPAACCCCLLLVAACSLLCCAPLRSPCGLLTTDSSAAQRRAEQRHGPRTTPRPRSCRQGQASQGSESPQRSRGQTAVRRFLPASLIARRTPNLAHTTSRGGAFPVQASCAPPYQTAPHRTAPALL